MKHSQNSNEVLAYKTIDVATLIYDKALQPGIPGTNAPPSVIQSSGDITVEKSVEEE